MKTRTHYLIAKTVSLRSGLSALERYAFCFGAMMPDFLPTQFIHKHFYQKSADYVFSKIEKYSKRNSLFSFFKLGEMSHYSSDFCCFVHRSGGIGNAAFHLSYEHRIQHYFLEYYDQLTEESFSLTVPSSLQAVFQSYFDKDEMEFHTDISSTVKASLFICSLKETESPKELISFSDSRLQNISGNSCSG